MLPADAAARAAALVERAASLASCLRLLLMSLLSY